MFLTTTAKILLMSGLVVLLGFLLLSQGMVGTTFANSSSGDGLELTIDSRSIYNGEVQPQLSWELKDLVPGVDRFFDFADIKPGDTGTQSISIHVDNHPAYVCMDFSNLTEAENGVNEPESLVDVTLGADLAAGTEFFAWRDDGDSVFEPGERPLFGTDEQAASTLFSTTTYPLAEAGGERFEEGETYYVGMTWCAGDLTVDLGTGAIACDATALGNEAQTDSFSVDIGLRAVEASNFFDFTCEDPSIDLFLEKKFSGPQEGYVPEQFSFRVEGPDVDEIVPHGGTVALPVGFFTITELTPPGFAGDDWRIQWSGDLCTGLNVPNSIGEIDIGARDLRRGTTYCRVDNQFRPESNPNRGDNGHGNDTDGNDDSNPGSSNDPDDDTDEDGLPPGQQAAGGPPGQSLQGGVGSWQVVEERGGFSRSRAGALFSRWMRL
ncbi:hypothetical protein N9L26_00720 [Candidatus Pacebacteria bacterium]|nr:hypothetical protein [Candidatus Paceibacterota bacterium]